MKLMMVMFFLAITNLMASEAYSQTTRMTLQLKDATVKEVLNKIEENSEFFFLYNGKLVDVDRKVSVDVNDQKINEILSDLFRGTDVFYTVVDRQIVLTDKASQNSFVQFGSQQQQKVTGTITDKNGAPVPGTNVVVTGTTQGAMTDIAGNYSIDIPKGAKSLTFSFIGMVPQEISIGTSIQINVTMTESATALEEVVVIGYGTSKKIDLTGSISSVKADELNKGASVSVDQLLSGRMAGVRITQNSGEPGGESSIRIRGTSSITGGNNPLFVLDGMPIDNSPLITETGVGISPTRTSRNPLNLINPDDIESVEVLKDASATAIYGARGANGVILITTKKGTSGQTKITYNYSGGVQTLARKLEVLDALNFATIINDICSQQGQSLLFPDIGAITNNTDWLDEVTRTGYIQNHNFNVSGGNEKNKLYASVGYYNQKGIVMSSGLNRYTARINAESTLSQRFKYGINLTNSYIIDDEVPSGTGFNTTGGIIYSALESDPTTPVYDANGTFFTSYDVDYENPVALADVSTFTKTSRMMGNTYAEYNILPSLKARVNVGFDLTNSKKDTYIPTTLKMGISRNGIASVYTAKRFANLFEGTLNYSKEFYGHNIGALAGCTWEDFTADGVSVDISDFPSDVTLTNNLGIGNTEMDNLSSYKNSNRLISYLWRINYNYQSKYYFTGAFRADGSSKFGINNKFGYFPSFAVAWRVSEESFMDNLKTINNMKLRVSWGKTGNQDIGNYSSLSTFGSGAYAILNDLQITGVSPARIPNPDLKWETTSQFDIGFDLSLFKSRISATVDYFDKLTTDLLLDVPIPMTSGFSTILSNVGVVSNKGIELNIESVSILKQNFSWTTSVTFTSIKNKVVDLGGVTQIITGDLPHTPGITIIKEDYPLNSYYGTIVDGIWQIDDDIANSAQPTAQPGFPKWRDLNNDKIINSLDMTTIGSPFPDFSLGIRNTLQYKNFTLDLFFSGDFGQEIFNLNLVNSLMPLEYRRNRFAEPMLNRWTPENPTNKWPSGVNTSLWGGSKVNSLGVQNGTFFRLKSSKLSYNLDFNKVKFLDNATIYILGDNLLLFTDYLGFDPEVNAMGNNSAAADYSPYPSARTITFGITIGF
ncbi:MAG: TonB-dependent receptor [Bacteroidia bacterium]|nr:TonB-dependent receptor [Bacteroidia bacterium]